MSRAGDRWAGASKAMAGWLRYSTTGYLLSRVNDPMLWTRYRRVVRRELRRRHVNYEVQP